MFSESKVTEIYCMTDDFCTKFALQQKKYIVEDQSHKHRNKPNRLSDAEIIVTSCSILVASDASNIIIRNISANICHICFPGLCLITALWN